MLTKWCKVFIYVLFLYVKHKKLPFLAVLTWFLILVKIQDGGQDGRPLLQTSQASSYATTHEIYLILLRRSKAFLWKQNRFEILQHIKNSKEGFHQPPPLVPQWGYEFACTSKS